MILFKITEDYGRLRKITEGMCVFELLIVFLSNIINQNCNNYGRISLQLHELE